MLADVVHDDDYTENVVVARPMNDNATITYNAGYVEVETHLQRSIGVHLVLLAEAKCTSHTARTIWRSAPLLHLVYAMHALTYCGMQHTSETFS